MDDLRFDSIARFLASGRSRRDVLKAMLGLGSGLAATSAFDSAEAARRPAPAPKAPTCPGQQVWSDGACVCPTGDKCGPDCCPDGATCCDNACCYGTCYGEELCCPSSQEWCAVSDECCPADWSCCPGFGCIAPGSCCNDSDCAQNMCAVSTCLENQSCSEEIENCNHGGSAVCCGTNAVCHADGSCLSASIAVEFVISVREDWCSPHAAFAAFLPNHTYDVEIGGYRGGVSLTPIWRQLTTDQSGAFVSTFNIAFLNGLDQVFVTVENVSSGMVAVSCS